MVAIERFIDKSIGALLVLLAALLRLFEKLTDKKIDKRIKQQKQFKKILIIKLWAVGDSVVALPMISAIKNKFKNAKITVLVRKRNRDVFVGQKFIDEIILFEPNNLLKLLGIFRKFDLVIDAEPYLNLSALISFYSGRTRIGFANQLRSFLYTDKVVFNRKQHVAQTYLDMPRLFGADYNKDFLIPLAYSRRDSIFVEELLKKHSVQKNKLFGICVGVAESVKSREWPLERFSKVADHLIDKYKVKIAFIGTSSESGMIAAVMKNMKHKSKAFSAAGKTNLKQVFFLISKCRVFISNDTGPMHIAAAQGCKTIGLFGPNIPALWHPYGSKNISVYKGNKVCEFSPCIRNEKGLMPKCRFGENNKCMRAITVKEVVSAVNQILKRWRARNREIH